MKRHVETTRGDNYSEMGNRVDVNGAWRARMLTVTRSGAYADAREQMTRTLLLRALDEHHWNLTHAANALGLTRQYVYQLLKRYGIKRVRPT